LKSFVVELESLLTVVAAVLDRNGVLLEANAGFRRLLAASATSPIGTKVARFFIQPNFVALMAAVEGDNADCYHGLLTIGDYAGTIRTLRGRAWRTDTGIRILAEYDIAELETLAGAVLKLNRESAISQRSLIQANSTLTRSQDRFLEESLTDALTGVGNRRRFEQALETEINRARRGEGPLSAVMADIDHFKRVNDEHGHEVGDKVLADLGQLLKSRTRNTDIVTRFGGEEFVILLPHTDLAQATLKAEQFRATLAARVIEALGRPVTASFGAAELGDGEDRESFFARIDAALYRAKGEGRNRVVAAP
jgi:two-component system cell cycle response regulator